jgi:NAD(P)-dependent dehydrogenase (short-subunit alcohol dehydrogenase family)
MNNRRTILITGVSRGLGRAMTEGFARSGHTVIGCARQPHSVLELLEEFPLPHNFEVVDVADDDQVGRWAERILAEFGPPDLLLNNAALINENAPLWDVPPDEFAQLVNVNIGGVYHVIRHFVPAMIQRGGGVIVNFSSGWGRSTSPDVAPYCTTKWAIEGMTRALADELPSDMAAVPLNPGVINTEMLQSCFGSASASYPSAKQWAEKAVPFLLSLDASHNGQPMTVPG